MQRKEISAVLCGKNPGLQLVRLDEEGMLEKILPEISAMRGVAQPPEYHPEGDVFTHTVIMLERMVYPDELLAWSVLLHDVGKPATYSVEPSGRIRFFGHELAGAEMAPGILARFGFEESEIGIISSAIRNHMRFANVREMRRAKVKAMVQAPGFPLELELHRLDCISSHRMMGCFDFLLDFMVRESGTEKKALPMISGKELIAAGVRPGPEMGVLLAEIEKLQSSGSINCREDVWDWMRSQGIIH